MFNRTNLPIKYVKSTTINVIDRIYRTIWFSHCDTSHSIKKSDQFKMCASEKRSPMQKDFVCAHTKSLNWMHPKCFCIKCLCCSIDNKISLSIFDFSKLI